MRSEMNALALEHSASLRSIPHLFEEGIRSTLLAMSRTFSFSLVLVSAKAFPYSFSEIDSNCAARMRLFR